MWYTLKHIKTLLNLYVRVNFGNQGEVLLGILVQTHVAENASLCDTLTSSNYQSNNA